MRISNKIKQLLSVLLIFGISFSAVGALEKSQVETVLDKFYQRLESKFQQNTKRISILAKIQSRLDKMLQEETDVKRIELLNIVDENIENKIIQYEKASVVPKFAYKKLGLNTNTAIKSIDLRLVLSGGPGKDGIPSINNPKFFSVDQPIAQEGLKNRVLGIAVSIGGESKFYPYSVLYWHEIVNDTLGGEDIAVTFCPLCGTAIAYDRNVDGRVVDFGVSGKLYESNLLMYDNVNHSLWSQSLGEAVVGEFTGTQLEVIKSDLISYATYKKLYPEGLVLSEDTGFNRDYGRTPYGSYERTDSLFFPVSNSDKRLHVKELLFVLPYKGESYAFIRSKLEEVGTLDYMVQDEKITIEYDEGIITATDKNSQVIPGYIEMFFSWATQHPDNQNLWGIEK